MNYQTFGEFLRDKRVRAGISLRGLAKHLDISAAFLSDVEHNARNPFDIKKLHLISTLLSLSEEEIYEMYDLVGKKRGEIPPDVQEYISSEKLSDVLRDIRKTHASTDDWNYFLSYLKGNNDGSYI